MIQKLMIRCPLKSQQRDNVLGIDTINGKVNLNTGLVPIETCATIEDGKNCRFVAVTAERQAQPDFNPDQIRSYDYIDSNGIDLVGIQCAFPQWVQAIVVEVPDNEPSRILRLS